MAMDKKICYRCCEENRHGKFITDKNLYQEWFDRNWSKNNVWCEMISYWNLLYEPHDNCPFLLEHMLSEANEKEQMDSK